MDEPSDELFFETRAHAWDVHADAMEPFAAQFGGPAIDRLDPAPGDRLADIGCGPGLTTLELASRVGPSGRVAGIDVSPAMVASGARRAAAAGLDNARFEIADPGAGPIGTFDAIYSRFGVMFFDDPVVAFTNLERSTRPGGRFAAAVWAEIEANAWMFVPVMHAAGLLRADVRLPAAGEPGPFSLAQPEHLVDLLTRCGFVGVDVTRCDGAWTFDESTAAPSIGAVLAMGPLGESWMSADDELRRAAVDAVREGCETYRDGAQWHVPAAAWIVSASTSHAQ